MDAPQNKVTAKLTQPGQGHHASGPAVHAKISRTARTRTRSAVTAPSPPSSDSSSLFRVKPSARRSPSPSRMFQVQPASVHPMAPKVARGADRTRHGSISSIFLPASAKVSSSEPATPLLGPSQNGDTLHPYSQPYSSIRVKAKVSGLAKSKSATAASASTPTDSPAPSTIVSPPSPDAHRPVHRRTISESSPSPSPSPSHLPPLPTSPPSSTLSFSSHSSASPSSQRHATSPSVTPSPPSRRFSNEEHPGGMSSLVEDDDDVSPVPTPVPPPYQARIARVRPGTSVSGGRRSVAGSAAPSAAGSEEADTPTDSEEDRDDDVEPTLTEHDRALENERAEAKSNRKIADLEIRASSLLAVNASLETAKAKQARELRELRRRIREMRLALPPRKFRQLHATEASFEDLEGSEEEEEEGEEEGEVEDYGNDDDMFSRLRVLIMGMLDTARHALAAPSPTSHLDRISGKGAEVLGWERGGKHGVAIGSRVLSPEEAEQWTRTGREGSTDDGELPKELKDIHVENGSPRPGDVEEG